MGNAHRPIHGCKEQQIAQFLLLSAEDSRAYESFWCGDVIEGIDKYPNMNTIIEDLRLERHSEGLDQFGGPVVSNELFWSLSYIIPFLTSS